MYKSARFFIMTPLPRIKKLANYFSIQGMGGTSWLGPIQWETPPPLGSNSLGGAGKVASKQNVGVAHLFPI